MSELEKIKADICAIGRRMWQRGLVAGSDGNISVRLNDEQVLCTPTMCSKGFMQPADICLLELSGEQVAGEKRRSSEVLLHLEILKARPDVMSVVHCHPPHATAFAITGRSVPMGAMAEADVLLGDVPIVPYETPGTAAFAQKILPFVHDSNACLLANHGAVTFGPSLEQAYNLMEVLDAYCRIVLLSEQLGSVRTLAPEHRGALVKIRTRGGFAPPGK
ncbi:MAG: class II aldolase/adducin family protein [Bythopirellula sp.]|nr:class II aldolase/adducin family protein [Bythopirellula sp.]